MASKKSIKVCQPAFSEWVIQRRQELNLSQACLSQKIGGDFSIRTLYYLEDGKRDRFTEFTLMRLAQGLDMEYPQ